MKKLFYLILLISVITSCSSDSDGTDPNTSATKRTVSFNVKSSNFTVETSPLNSRGINIESNLCQFVVYKETGEVYSDSILYSNDIQQSINGEGVLPIKLELPVGKYNVAILSTSYSPQQVKNQIIKPVNFNTDYYLNTNPNNLASANSGIFYETISLTVTNQGGGNAIDVELKPMWAVLNITIEDSQTIKVPVGTELLEIVVGPEHNGFSIKTKMANNTDYSSNKEQIFIPVENLAKLENISIKTLSTASEEAVSVKVNYSKEQGTTILGTKTLVNALSIKNATNYKISGKMGNAPGLDGESMNITLGEFDAEDVNVPFFQ